MNELFIFLPEEINEEVLIQLGTFKGIYMNILLALSGLKSEGSFMYVYTSTQTALTCLAESPEPVSGVDKSMSFGKVFFILGKAMREEMAVYFIVHQKI